MKFKSWALISMSALLVYACNRVAPATQQSAEEPVATPADTSTAAQSQNTAAEETNPNLVANMSWTFLTDQLFQHSVTVKAGVADTETDKGHWVDFKDNGTYDYGVWGDKLYSGNWTYNDTTQTLLLKPSGSQKPSEWQVMHKDRKLVLIGTATYGDNPYQVQWIRYAQRPDKNAKPEEDEYEDE